MPKPIAQRGFSIDKGKIDEFGISYYIDNKGLEKISVHKDFSSFISITSGGGYKIYSF